MKNYNYSYLKNFNSIKKNSSVAIYGAGGRGHKLFHLIKKNRPDVNVICFIDDSLTFTLTNLPIDNYESCLNKFNWDYIFIASIHAASIIKKLNHDENIFLFSITNFEGVNIIDKINYKFLIKNIFKIIYIIYKLSNVSRNLYFQLLLQRVFGIGNAYKIYVSKLFSTSQYFEYINSANIINIIDAGVYDGYTSSSFFNSFLKLKNIYGFDISDKPLFKSNYKKFLDTRNFYLFLKPLSDNISDVYISINESNPSASKVESNFIANSTILQSITIDKFCLDNNIKVDFIKFDIEGGESNALKGGINSIINNRPQLAVSIYHSPEDFIFIPYYLINKLTNYNFYIGHYSIDIYETVLYAIPLELDKN